MTHTGWCRRTYGTGVAPSRDAGCTGNLATRAYLEMIPRLSAWRNLECRGIRMNLTLAKQADRMLAMKTILVDAMDAFVIEGKGIFKEMHDLLESFPNKKIILTNANDDQMREFGLDKMPYEVFTLKHNPNKPDPAYYKKMLEHFGLSKNEVVYFEHDEDAVKSAKSMGINTLYYDPEKKDLKALEAFLKKNS
jgi:HAD superfamily hydrolase (TIGR01509 family)